MASTGETPNEQQPSRRKRPWYAVLGAVLLVFAIAGGVALGGAYLWYENGIHEALPHAGGAGQPGQPVAAGGRVNILVLGMDNEGVRSDTMMVLSFDPATRDVGILSIPRDSRVKIYTAGEADIRGLAGTDLDQSQMDKINAATAYRTPELDGITRSEKTVENLLGVPIDYYVKVKLSGFVSLVDRLGGIDFYVPQTMNYDDPYQNLHIHLTKGMQHLNGTQVMELARYRGYYGKTPQNSDDLERIQVQHAILRTLLAKMESLGMLANLPGVATDLARAVSTDIPASKLVSLAMAARGMTADQVQMGTLPGRPAGPADGFSRDYFLPDMKAGQALIDQLLRGKPASEQRAAAPPVGAPQAAQGTEGT